MRILVATDAAPPPLVEGSACVALSLKVRPGKDRLVVGPPMLVPPMQAWHCTFM